MLNMHELYCLSYGGVEKQGGENGTYPFGVSTDLWWLEVTVQPKLLYISRGIFSLYFFCFSLVYFTNAHIV